MAYFLRRVRERTEAEDLTQEVMVRALTRDDRGGDADAYVFRIARNLLIDRARKHQVRQRFCEDRSTDPDFGIDGLDPFSIVLNREQMSVFVAALADLPERTRTMFILFRLENLTQEQIGRAHGISASAVKQHVAKAMAVLSKRMRDVR